MGQHDIQNQPRIHQPLGSAATDRQGYETLAQQADNGDYTLSVLIGGVHCAGCIQKIESTLARAQDVHLARLNFSTNRLSLAWGGPPDRANDFVRQVENLGYSVQPYDAGAEQSATKTEERFLLLCLGIGGFAMGNIMLISFGLWMTDEATMGAATRGLLHWIEALIALPAIIFAGRPFFRSALGALTKGHANMDVPISLALVLACGMSLFETIHGGAHVYFDSAVMLMFFLLIGRYLDFRARRQARSSATDLLSTLSGFATVVEGGSTRRMLVRDLLEDMVVRVRAGEKFPVDATLIDGMISVDTSLVTGETVPRDVGAGDDVYAGTLNMGGPVDVRVAKAAEDSLLADIVRLMEQAAQGQAAYVRLADRAARLYTPVVHSIAALAFFGWWLAGGMAWQDALMIAITVLIITCPCALGLAVPVVQVLASDRLMKRHILVKSGDALERLAGIDTAVMDKTGTLTLGRPQLTGDYDADYLALAASLAVHSAHPLSRALAAAYSGPARALKNISEEAGQGLSASYNGKGLRLGRAAWCGVDIPLQDNRPALWFAVEGQPPCVFYFTDSLRTDARATLDTLRARGLDILLLSGDRQEVAEDVARQAGISRIYAGQTPVDKFNVMEQLKHAGHNVLMVGDGLNDAPVLAGASVSMAPGSAIDMAQNAADIIFMGDDFSPVLIAYDTAVMAQKLVKQNFALAIAYNFVAVPLALAGMVTPLIAAIAMSGSSLVVILNSFRLRLRA